MSDSEDDWAPPSEAQMKVIQAKRERSDKISKLMGDYLLKGYKMLATSCQVCFTVELQDRSGLKFCVACQEVDCHETSKDDPALSQQAAERVVEEEQYSTVTTSSEQIQREQISITDVTRSLIASPEPQTFQSSISLSQPVQTQATTTPSGGAGARPRTTPGVRPSTDMIPPVTVISAGEMSSSSSLPSGDPETALLTQSLATVTATLETANRRLQNCNNAEKMTKLVILIREASTTIVTLKQLLCDK